MTAFFTYTRLRIKAVMKIFVPMCVMTFLLVLSLGGMLYMQSSQADAMAGGDENARLSLGVVGVSSSGVLSTFFPLLQNMDSSSQEAHFISYESRKEAAAAIRSGEISAAIIIPEGFMDKLLQGETGKMTLIFPASGTGIESILVRELSSSVSAIISSMESASSILAQSCTDSGINDWDAVSGYQTEMLLTSIQDLLHRSRLFSIKYVDTAEQVSVESYYLIAMMLLLYLLLGVMCAGSYIRTDSSLNRLLRIRGLNSFLQVIGEWISLLVLLCCISAVFIPLIGAALCHMPITFSAFGVTESVFMRHFLRFGIGSVPAVLLAASIDILIYEMSPNLITGVLAQFIIMISLAYASGIFYAADSMPGSLRTVSSLLPTGQALRYLQRLSRHGSGMFVSLFAVLLWTAVFLCLSVMRRSVRISSKGGA